MVQGTDEQEVTLRWKDEVLGDKDRSICTFKNFDAAVGAFATLDSDSPTGAKVMWRWEVYRKGGYEWRGVAPSREAAKARAEQAIREGT